MSLLSRMHGLMAASCVGLTTSCSVLLLVSAAHAAGNEQLLSFTEIQESVAKHFQKKPNYQRGDLITKSDVQSLLVWLHGRGFKLTEFDTRYEAFLSDQEFVVQLLRTSEGKVLSRKVQHLPNFYDRVQRLCTFEEGKKLALKLIQSGDIKAAEYLCSAEGGRKIVAQYGPLPALRNFETVSGRVYTEQDFVRYLHNAYILAFYDLKRPSQ